MVADPNSGKPPPETLEQIYYAYEAELRRLFRRKAHDPHAIEDLVQTVYLQLLGAHPREPIRDPQKYVLKTAWQVLIRENQEARHHQLRTVSADACTWDEVVPRSTVLKIEDDTQTALTLALCEEALRQLPANQKTILLLQYRDSLSREQIAARLNLTIYAVKKYVSQALAAIRKHITQDMSDPGEGPGATS
jgi:RNA polymerase sigma factor (sigma-70 family)